MTIKLDMIDSKLFEEYLLNQKGLMESSIRTYVGVVNQMMLEVDDFEILEDYNRFLVKYAIKKRCGYYYNVVRAFIDWKVSDTTLKDYLLENLVRPQKRNDFKYERKYLSEEKIFDILNSLKEENHRMIALIQTLTGVRAGDVMRMKVGSIMPEEYEGRPVLRLNIIGKGGKRNVAYIHDEVAQHIVMNYIANGVDNANNFYFCKQGTFRRARADDFHVYKQNYARYWIDLKQALQSNMVNKNDFATHDFRRCFARRVWEKWKDVHVLQGLLNHARPDTTLRYLEQSGLKNIDYFRDIQNG